MMMSNNPMFLQEQDFQAKHSDLLQAAREGKAWEPRKFESVKTTWDALANEWYFVDRKIFVQTETQTIEFSEPCNPNEW